MEHLDLPVVAADPIGIYERSAFSSCEFVEGVYILSLAHHGRHLHPGESSIVACIVGFSLQAPQSLALDCLDREKTESDAVVEV